ncbi:efflux RND transporter periplasmic adaptor subunit [Planctomycetota bacterium]
MKKGRIIIISIFVPIAIISIVGMIINAKVSNINRATTVRLEQPQLGELIEYVSAPGEIWPKKMVEISSKVSARIIELPYEEGDIVTCGDPTADPPIPASVLIRLDAKDLESQLSSARANASAQAAQIEVEQSNIASRKATLVGTEASLKQAHQDLERQRGLLESKDISQSTFDQTQLKLDELQAQYESSKLSIQASEGGLIVSGYNLDAAQARVTEAEEALSYTTITSPIDGIITRINAEVGVMVLGTLNNMGTDIMQVADLSQMLVVAQVDEADVAKLQIGQKAVVDIDAYPDRQFNGVVSSVALSYSSSSSGTKYFQTEMLLDSVEDRLYSGLTAHVEIETSKYSEALTLPTQAILGTEIDELPSDIRENSPEVDKDKKLVTVVYRYIDGKAVVTPVIIGQSDLTHTIIESGITAEDKVVVGPYTVLDNIGHNQSIQDESEVEEKRS